MPKIYAACGAAGFALSFIVGLFSGAPFLIILLRALIFGVVFAGLAVLFGFLLNRFVPDLFDKSAAPASKPNAKGGKLDITISDDGDASLDDDDFTVPDFMKERNRSRSALFSASAASSAGEVTPESAQSEAAPSAPAQDDAKPAVAASEPGHASAEEAGGELGAMPEASDFIEEDEYEGDVVVETDSSEKEPPRPTAARNISISDSGVDAETMAKAIRTVLSKGD